MKKIIFPLLLVLLAKTFIAQNTCASAIVINQTSLPYASGALTTCGTNNNYGVGAGACNTTYGGGEDYVFRLNITTAPATYSFSLGGAGTWKICQIFNGCPSPVGAPTNCLGNFVTGGGTTGSASFTFPSTGAYYIVIDTWPPPACGAFTLGITAPPPPPTCPGGLGAGYTAIASLPYNSGAQTTCGMVNNLTSTNVSPVCGSSAYYGGEDAVYSFTPTTTGTISIDVASTGSWMGVALYQGCPFSGGTCVGTAQSSAGNQTLCPTVTAGQVYYLIIDSWPAPTCNPYTLNISSCTSAPPGGTAASASSTVCNTGGTVALSVSGSIAGGCGNSFQWQSAPSSFGPWTNIIGATAVGYTPSINGFTCFRRRSTCAAGSGTSTSVCVNVATCPGAPTGGNAVSTPTAACAAGGTVALSSTGGSSGCGYIYQWQTATSSAGPWSNIAGATGSTAIGSVSSATTCFRRIIACGSNSATSAPVCVSAGNCISQLGSGVISIGSLPYSTSGTTCGSVNDLTTANVTSAGCSSSSYFTGEDQVFVFTPTTSGNVTFSLTSTGTWTGLMLYNTCPLTCAGSAGCVGSSTSSSGNKTFVACVVAGTTYYLILDSFAAPACNPYSNLSISAPGAVSPSSNDVCASPTPLSSSGSFTANTNVYTADSPGNLSSVFCGSIENNQWFSFTANATTATFSVSGVAGASCGAGVQAQVFAVNTTGGTCPSCNSFTSVSTPCYNPGTLTAGSVTASGLTVGQTYYLMVDGNGGAQCNFTIGGWGIAPLPVTLISFTGESYGTEMNKLSWKVAQEKDLGEYIIERSNDGVHFFSIGTQQAVNSYLQTNYVFYDKQAGTGLNYYRLKMVEKTGETRNSKIIAIDNISDSKFELNKVFPNPTNSVIYASVQVKSDCVVKMEVSDLFGKVILSTELAATMGTNILPVNMESYSKGIYFIRLECNKEIKVAKFSFQ